MGFWGREVLRRKLVWDYRLSNDPDLGGGNWRPLKDRCLSSHNDSLGGHLGTPWLGWWSRPEGSLRQGLNPLLPGVFPPWSSRRLVLVSGAGPDSPEAQIPFRPAATALMAVRALPRLACAF